MSEFRKLRYYGYVERPYEAVRTLLHAAPLELFQGATISAARRGRAVLAHLRVGLAGVEIGVDVRTLRNRVWDEEAIAGMPPVTAVEIDWEAVRAPSFFPLMRAKLSAWPVLSSETQVEIEGTYRAPLGAVGSALDALIMHRVAEASVHRFLEDLLEQIRREVPSGR